MKVSELPRENIVQGFISTLIQDIEANAAEENSEYHPGDADIASNMEAVATEFVSIFLGKAKDIRLDLEAVAGRLPITVFNSTDSAERVARAIGSDLYMTIFTGAGFGDGDWGEETDEQLSDIVDDLTWPDASPRFGIEADIYDNVIILQLTRFDGDWSNGDEIVTSLYTGQVWQVLSRGDDSA